MAKIVNIILKLSPTHFVSNIRHQNRCSRFDNFKPLRDPDRNFIICGFEAGKLFGF